jgi:hypothetical protein
MMSIARSFPPPAAHTPVREQAAQRFIPCALVGIHPLPFVNVGLALVPRNNRANSVNSIDCGGSLSVRFLPVLMPSYEETLTPFLIKTGARLTTAASAFNGIHRQRLYHRHRIITNRVYRQNAVAVPVAEWIGRRIVTAQQQEKPQ